ncbi:hypothetical protein TGRH88_004660 [Toxoplasma gondii]|uniref:Uncharacterized protein n=1 Tax=Toxoplasma gondii TaxID=5811 RepID=A0A7J6KEZ7_TOXGO|nr:hypothetical protein TGRH88_004660 [Toxoplasma gondii]
MPAVHSAASNESANPKGKDQIDYASSKQHNRVVAISWWRNLLTAAVIRVAHDELLVVQVWLVQQEDSS